ncbi:hypothetical protein EVAR_57826_1 [Eumeta japonica]|uniref:Uncharacterized protein n=1 Tax=Eumeta variegata TaxID=151549 RepID=A0A4C2A1C7_EUMVA|nr:hypothetical protein EVAR_57826_1 [Eumeta japonica]
MIRRRQSTVYLFKNKPTFAQNRQAIYRGLAVRYRNARLSKRERLLARLSDEARVSSTKPAVTVEEDDPVSTDNSSGSPADSGNFKIWTSEMGPLPLDRRGRIPNEKTSGHEATNKSSFSHLHPQKRVWKIREQTNGYRRLVIDLPTRELRYATKHESTQTLY